ncbi:MAG: CoA-binding protein [Ilumatobacteraceae bacterium]
MAILESAAERLDLMQHTNSVAIVGMSSNRARASHFVATYLAGKTEWTVWYVNPRESEILGQPVYPSLSALPSPPDLVDVFRRADELSTVVDKAIDVGAQAVWFQLGLEHDAAAAAASEAGLAVVQNRCLKIEHARFAGGLHCAGFVTGVIDSRRTRLI